MSTKQSIGTKPAFPQSIGPSHNMDGMSYRQWLIGIIAAGAQIGMSGFGDREQLARSAVQRADAIIEALDKESSYPKT